MTKVTLHKPGGMGKSEHVFAAPVAVAVLSEDRRFFTLTVGGGVGAWSGRYPIERLDGSIAFYRGLIRRRPASARFYEPSVRALERVKAELGGTS